MYLRLRELREDRDKSQTAMAAVLGCSQQTYSRYENEKVQMTYATLDRLADYFGVSVDYLLGRPDERTPYPKSRHK